MVTCLSSSTAVTTHSRVSYEDTNLRYKLELPEVEDPRQVSRVAAEARHHQEGAGVQRRYEIYKNAMRCTKMLQDVRERYDINNLVIKSINKLFQ